MKNNPLQQLETLGQSLWLDYIRRNLIASGELRRLIEEDKCVEKFNRPFDKLMGALAKPSPQQVEEVL